MDILTQFVLGASVCSVGLPKENPNKTVFIGGALAILPDLDIFIGHRLDSYSELIFHRSWSHAILPFVVLTLITWFLSKKLKIFPKSSSVKVLSIIFLVLFTHALLDCFTTWGTQLFWPLPMRIGSQTVYVIDLIYSVPLGLALFYFWIMKGNVPSLRVLKSGLIFSTCYLAILFFHQQLLIYQLSSEMNDFKVKSINTQPILLRPFSYRIVIETEESFNISKTTHHIFSNMPQDFFIIDKGKEHLNSIKKEFDIKELEILSHSYLAVKKLDDNKYTLLDLRYGPTDPKDSEYKSSFTYHISLKNGKWEFSQEERMFGKLNLLWNKFLFEIGF